MSFGKNPHVAKALAAELKASEAPDDLSRVRALREAAHLWDRAASREMPGARRTEYEEKSAKNRAEADADPAPAAPEQAPEPPPVDPRSLN